MTSDRFMLQAIPNQPSDQIKDFIAFMTTLAGQAAYPARRGATPEEVSALAGCSPFPLPQLYLEYLREFGTDAGGFELAPDTRSDIASLLEFHQVQPPIDAPIAPDNCLIFAIANASHGRAFDFTEHMIRSEVEPRVVAYYDDGIDYVSARSFRNYLYSEGYLLTRRHQVSPYKCRLTSNRPCDMAELAVTAVQFGFSMLWFSDEHRTCAVRSGDSFVICKAGVHTMIDLEGTSDSAVADIRSVLLRSFPFQEY